MSLHVTGGSAGVGAQLEELDALALALADAAGNCAELVVAVVRAGATAAGPGAGEGLGTGLLGDPWAAVELAGHTATAVSLLCRAGGELATLASAVTATAAVYRAREGSVEAMLRGVPLLVGARVRAGLLALVPFAPLLPVVAGSAAGGAAGVLGAVGVPGAARVGGSPATSGAGGLGSALRPATQVVVAHPGAVDVAVRLLPGVLGAPGVPALARIVLGAGDATGLLVETPVAVSLIDAGAACTVTVAGSPATRTRPADGVAELLRRNQFVAAWREPGPRGHDTLPPGAERPLRGQVRVDRVTGADGAVSWVVHVPGTQEWDGDGHGSPMDMAANVGLVAGADTGVATGVATAMARAGVRPGQPVALVGHSQGGMTAMDVAADPRVRRNATVTHVITAGSPVAGRTPPPGVQVLALEHPDDLVPRLDGRVHPDRPDRVTVRTPAPTGPWRRDAVPAHSSSAYVVTAGQVDVSQHPSLVAYRAGLAPFLDREGARCTTQQFVLRRAGTRGPPA